MRYLSRFISLVLFASLLAPVVAHAADAPASGHFPPAVVAVVDIERIVKESAAGKSVREQLDKQRASYQQQVTADEQKLRDAQKALMEERSKLSAEQFDAKRRDFETQARATQQRVQDKARALDNAFGEALATIKKSVGQIVADIAASKGATVVLDRGQVIVVEAKLDLTKDVLEQLNKKLPRVDVKTPAASR